jgi:hypothetical protein
MQCGMRNHCSDLFICFINYLHALCMIFMILSCVPYIILMMFIYVYYGLFTYTNLIDVISVFFTVFSFYLLIFNKNCSVSDKNRLEIVTPVF